MAKKHYTRRNKNHDRRGYPSRELKKSGRKQVSDYIREYYCTTGTEQQLIYQIDSLKSRLSSWELEGRDLDDIRKEHRQEVEVLNRKFDSLKKNFQAMKDALEVKPISKKTRYSRIIRNIS